MSEPVGFTARAEEVLTYSQDYIIQFPLTTSNFGGYYNPASGLFTCPYDGIYMFFSSIRSDETNINCFMNKEEILLLSMSSADVASRSNLVITGCNRGERVWMRELSDNDIIDGSHSSTFSGFLLEI